METQPKTDAHSIAGEDDAPTKEMVDLLKKQLAEKTHDIAHLRAKTDAIDTQNRDFLAGLQADAVEHMKGVEASAEPHQKQYISALNDWAQNMHKHPAEKIDEQMPLAILVHNASATIKRTREDAAAAGEKEEALKSALAGNETLEVEKDKLQKRLNEMEVLANERQQQAEEVALRLAQVTGTAKRYDFSNPTSREMPRKITSGRSASEIAAEAPMSALATTIDAASIGNGKAPAMSIDPTSALASFVSQNGGAGSSRLMPTGSTHSLLGGPNRSEGSSSNTGTSDVVAAIRASNFTMM